MPPKCRTLAIAVVPMGLAFDNQPFAPTLRKMSAVEDNGSDRPRVKKR